MTLYKLNHQKLCAQFIPEMLENCVLCLVGGSWGRSRRRMGEMMEGMGRQAEEITRDHLVHHAAPRQHQLLLSFLTHLSSVSKLSLYIRSSRPLIIIIVLCFILTVQSPKQDITHQTNKMLTAKQRASVNSNSVPMSI